MKPNYGTNCLTTKADRVAREPNTCEKCGYAFDFNADESGEVQVHRAKHYLLPPQCPNPRHVLRGSSKKTASIEWLGIPPMYLDTQIPSSPTSTTSTSCFNESIKRAWLRFMTRRATSERFYSSSKSQLSFLDQDLKGHKAGARTERENRGKLVSRLTPLQAKRSESASATTVTKQVPWHLKTLAPYVDKLSNSSSEFGIAPRLLGSQIYLGVIRNWINTCETRHQRICQFQVPDNYCPLWLIDVTKDCLVPGSADTSRYAALSYVWGTGDSACTTISNIEALCKPNGLRSLGTDLPATIKDAMELVRNLEVRYLWIDRFCIIQDEAQSKQTEIAAMHLLFSNSLFTIVAAEKLDASGGLYEKRRIKFKKPNEQLRSKPQAQMYQSTQVQNDQIMLEHSQNFMRTKWFSRGWTFQEHLFARRRIIFHNNTVNWECSCSSWHEGQILSRDDSSTSTQVYEAPQPPSRVVVCPFHPTRWPDMHRYTRLVSMYNKRYLTYPEDAIDAFSGVLFALVSVFPGSFISGLPRSFFDATLIWQPWTPPQRRRSVRKPVSEACLPSWSWIGWQGTLHSESWRSAASYLKERFDFDAEEGYCSWTTVGTVSWSFSDTLQSERKPVHNTRLKLLSSHGEEGLPTGWSRHVSKEGRAMFRHTYDPNQEFCYPIPMQSEEDSFELPQNPRYLHAQTRRAFLKFGESYKSFASACASADLLDEYKNWAGAIRLTCLPLDPGIPFPGTPLELVEISAGSVDNQNIEKQSIDEWHRPQCPRHSGLYEFYNVLWVEWIDRVAYRKALGRVEKGVWDAVATEQIYLTLG
ncbi:HET-domain-containing protein [Lojkania enalia]|uniref:HET-domain-containing protein n=1 Tax=Lojkania enalia TaxID=147567 RepID=A0A9P4N5V6_9PLEO|nr:HET-domain-containing protein [Didymosphaeria enalia]